MKRLFSILLVFALCLSSFAAAAQDDIKVTLDGVLVDCKDVNGNFVPPILKGGTTYLPVRAISQALGLTIEWDDENQNIYINGKPENITKGDGITIYINSQPFVAKDIKGNVVAPFSQNGSTYLPVRAIGEAFDKRVSWDGATKTAVLSTPVLEQSFSPGAIYSISPLSDKNKAITSDGSNLLCEPFEKLPTQGFRLIKSDIDGYYYIRTVNYMMYSSVNDKNFDVNGNSKNPGASIITYTAGTADNQKFAFEKADNGYIIYAKSSRLPIEDSAGKIKQNVLRDSVVQRWVLTEFTPVTKAETVSYTLSLNGKLLSDTTELSLSSGSITESEQWLLTANDNGEYTITNKQTGKSLDVANNSKASGDPVITYTTSSDANQRWVFEKQADNTYLIKSVHSDLYLAKTSNGDNIVHSAIGDAMTSWTVEITK